MKQKKLATILEKLYFDKRLNIYINKFFSDVFKFIDIESNGHLSLTADSEVICD